MNFKSHIKTECGSREPKQRTSFHIKMVSLTLVCLALLKGQNPQIPMCPSRAGLWERAQLINISTNEMKGLVS